MFDATTEITRILDLGKKEIAKATGSSIPRSTNEPEWPTLANPAYVLEFLALLPAEQRYDAAYDPNLPDEQKTALLTESGAEARAIVNTSMRANQISMLESMKDAKVPDFLKTLITETVWGLLIEVSTRIADHLSITATSNDPLLSIDIEVNSTPLVRS